MTINKRTGILFVYREHLSAKVEREGGRGRGGGEGEGRGGKGRGGGSRGEGGEGGSSCYSLSLLHVAMTLVCGNP